MAQQNQNPHPIGTPPKAFDGSADKATPFWNSLKSYYSINANVFTNEGKHVAAALTHFKLGMQAGDWASDRMATALAANPVDYGTWADFETAFKAQFIPPQTQNEAITKLYNTSMGNRSFNEWYQDWSMHARCSGVDDNSKMYAFRRMLNPQLHAKIIQLSLQPTTLSTLVEKARELDNNWQTFAKPNTGPGNFCRNPRIRELAENTPSAEINATQGRQTPFKKWGKLTPEEWEHRVKNNLCLYCSKPGHKAAECKAPPNKRPHPGMGTPLRQIETIQEEGPSNQEIKNDIGINSLSSNRFAALDSIQADSEIMIVTPSF
jgi:hypothetical protein